MTPTVQRSSLLLACLIVVSAGCIGGEVDPRPGTGHVGMGVGYHQNGAYTINGTVHFDIAIGDNKEFEHVTLCLYSQNGEILNSTDLGTFTAPSDSTTVRITADRRPRYVVVDHPEFREYPDFGPAVVHWTEDYVREDVDDPATSIEEFDYEYPTDAGKCGQLN